MSEFHTVCKAEELLEGQGRAIELGGKLVAVFKDQGQFFAIDDVCPHMGASLSDGLVENGIVTCPWHAWRFRLKDGAWADAPRVKIGCYTVRVQDGLVQVSLAPPTPAI